MGLGEGLVDNSTSETFEACDITSEWDSSAICVAVLIEEIWRADWRDLEWRNGRLTVPRTKNRRRRTLPLAKMHLSLSTVNPM